MQTMLNHQKISVMILVVFICLVTENLFATDMTLSGEIADTQTLESDGATTFHATVLKPTAQVTVTSRYEVILTAGTRVESGAQLHIILKDNDGLSNRWEDQFFPDLYTQGPSDDSDSDGMTNLQEYYLALNPTDGISDTDADGMPDWWEVQFFGYTLSHDPNGHDDDDGVKNLYEYMVGADPLANDLDGPGLRYQYDALGRLKRITRIPVH